MFGICLLGFIYGICQIEHGPTNPETSIPLAIGTIALVVLVPWERRQPEPAMELSLFLVPAFSIALLADAAFNFYTGGFGVLLGQSGTSGLGLSAAANRPDHDTERG